MLRLAVGLVFIVVPMLELLLLIKDPWRIYLTTDHPNGGCFWRYPEIIRLLMD